MDIYEPEEDSYLLAKEVKKHVKRGNSVLDIGCGSGIQCEEALKKTDKVTGVDINPNAIKHCKSSPYTKGATFHKSDVFSKVKDSYDVIIFNPPYLPDAKDPKEIIAYTTGGKKGYELTVRFLKEANTYLNENGCILLLFSSLTKKDIIDQTISHYLFESTLLSKESHMLETLYCYKITKSNLLKELNKLKVSNPEYFSKGQRGLIYKGTYKKKPCIIKVENNRNLATLHMETKWLKKVNELGIGPKIYYYDKNVILMEFLEGDFIIDYLKKASVLQKKRVILDVLKQMIILDKNKLAKMEMTRPIKHIIVVNHKPILIDFERTRNSLKPNNVTQFLQFLTSGLLGEVLTIDKKKVVELAKGYRKDYSEKQIIEFLKKEIKG